MCLLWSEDNLIQGGHENTVRDRHLNLVWAKWAACIRELAHQAGSWPELSFRIGRARDTSESICLCRGTSKCLPHHYWLLVDRAAEQFNRDVDRPEIMQLLHQCITIDAYHISQWLLARLFY